MYKLTQQEIEELKEEFLTEERRVKDGHLKSIMMEEWEI